MRVLVGCEYSGRVRDAFIRGGHDAMSCDLLDTETPGPHYTGNVFDIIEDGWDLAIFHPPCTDLAVSGARHFKEKWADGRIDRALDFVRQLLDAPIPRIALENPVSLISSQIRKADQYIEPWQHGHPEQKKTGLWLKNLPKLRWSNDVWDEMWELPRSQRERVHLMPPGPNRWKERSRTYPGIAQAMANQWGELK